MNSHTNILTAKNSNSCSQNEVKKSERLLFLPDTCIIADVETTGLSPLRDSVIEISALQITNNKVTGEFSSLIKPEKTVSSFITKLTGITNEMLANAPERKPVLEKFCDFLGDYPIVGHNVKFDISFINAALAAEFKPVLLNDYADTLYFSRRIYKNLNSHKLTNIAEYLNIDTKNAHRALHDCYMTYKIFMAMKNAAVE